MKLLGMFIVACFIIAAAQALTAALAAFAVVYGLVVYPRPTIATIFVLAALNAFQAHPIAFAATASLLVITALIRAR